MSFKLAGARGLGALLLLAPASLGAQSWQLKGHGVGLYDNSQADYDRTLRVVQPGSRWNLEDLTRQNAFSSNAPRTFGAWIQGPDPRTYQNSYGTPVFLYKIRVTNPRGQVQAFGPYGFSSGGHAVTGLGVQGGPFGAWKVEWFTFHRDTHVETLVASDSFDLQEHPQGPATAGAVQAQGGHVGFYDASHPDYDQVLRVVRTGSRWSLAQLGEMNAFQANGPAVFGVWYQGPHTRTFLNSYGLPMYYYKVKVTNPRGQARSYGPYGFTTPGFATYFLGDVRDGLPGAWKVEWFTVHRDTREERLVQTDGFEMAP